MIAIIILVVGGIAVAAFITLINFLNEKTHDKKKDKLIEGLYRLRPGMNKADVKNILGNGNYVDYESYIRLQNRHNPFNYYSSDIVETTILRTKLSISEELIYYTHTALTIQSLGPRVNYSNSSYIILVIFCHDKIKYVKDSLGRIIVDFRTPAEKNNL